jgi:hypothetical protein
MSIPNNTNILRITRVIAINESNYDYVQPLQIPSVGQSGKLVWYSTLDLLSSISVPKVSCSVLDILTTIQPGLSTFSTIVTSTLKLFLTSTVTGLGTSGYVSTLSLVSTVTGLGSSFVSPSLVSTVQGLGSSGYVSSFINIPSISTQSLVVSSIGVNCNVPSYTVDVNGSINSASNIFINGIPVVTVNTASNVISPSIVSTVAGLGNLGYVSSFINIPQMSIQTPIPYGGYLLDVNGPVQGAVYYSTLSADITPRQSATPISLTPANFGVFYNLSIQTIYTITLCNSSVSNVGKYNVFRNNSPGIISVYVSFMSPTLGYMISPIIVNQYQSITFMVATSNSYALF